MNTTRLRILFALCFVTPFFFTFTNCARESRPTGGLKDTTAPVVLRTRPHNGATNQQNLNRIRIDFNEFIVLKNPSETCIISPPLAKTPKMTTRRRTLTINLKGIALRDSTTYTLTFTNSIADVNEGNILNQFIYAFSTGTAIDTLQIAGKVIDAESGTASQTAFVLLHRNTASDSAIFAKKPDYVTQVRNDGSFTLSNIAAGEYRIYAVDNDNRDFMFNAPNEKIAFHEEIISPRAERYTDTTWFRRAGDTIAGKVAERDSFSLKEKTRFLPNNIQLSVFTNQAQTIDIISQKRLTRFAWGAKFSTAVTPSDFSLTIPQFSPQSYVIEQVAPDSVLLWLRDTALISAGNAKILFQRKQRVLDTTLHTDTFQLSAISTIPARLQAVSIPENPILFSGDSLHIAISRPIAVLNAENLQLYSLRDSFALWSSKGTLLQKNPDGSFSGEVIQRMPQPFKPKLFYQTQKILSQRLGTNRCALYFAKVFNPADIRLSLKAYPDLQNWYISEYDAETNALLIWFTNPDVRLLKNPILEVSFPEGGVQGSLRSETVSFSTVLTAKDRFKSLKNGKLHIALSQAQEKSFFVDNAIEIVCNNPITAVHDSLIRMVDLKDSLHTSIITRCEVSKLEARKVLIFHTAQPGKSYLITLEKNALTDVFGNTSRTAELSISAQGETTALYHTKENFTLARSGDTLRNFAIQAAWKEGQKYALVLSSQAIFDIYGDTVDSTQLLASSPLLENYGSLAVHLANAENMVLELLPAKTKDISNVKYVAYERNENTIVFSKIEPGSYNLRAFIDVNNNRRWDTGNFQQRRKAEKRIRFDGAIEIKAGRQSDIQWEN
ncbi:MAG: Ig-like domain-containing protein [Bacteroidales bacterium]|jgi:hypothetical protein|nr:Ig-like domain-containing protein [Bacteroidales bacterium]